MIELEIVPGLKEIVLRELTAKADDRITLHPCPEADTIWLDYRGSPADLHQMRTVMAVYLLLHFDIPRPKALLGHQHFKRVTGQIDRVRGSHPSGTFRTFRFSAAGRHSSVFQRLKDMLKEHTRMENNREEADLFLRMRPALTKKDGWELLIRTTPRPLTTRSWRACDMLGALNGTIAAAMIQLSNPDPNDRFFNPMCGSSTLLIERALHGPAHSLIGCDISADAIACSHENIAAAALGERINSFVHDVTQLDLADDSVDVICSDIPWGHRTGTHEANTHLYPAFLAEMGRISKSEGRMIIITHDMTLFEDSIAELEDVWTLSESIRVLQGGLHPRIYLLQRK